MLIQANIIFNQLTKTDIKILRGVAEKSEDLNRKEGNSRENES